MLAICTASSKWFRRSDSITLAEDARPTLSELPGFGETWHPMRKEEMPILFVPLLCKRVVYGGLRIRRTWSFYTQRVGWNYFAEA